jgi:hypothetical protein
MIRCPECSTLNSPESPACSNCGLLLAVIVEQPKRRRDDLEAQRRRANDKELTSCPFCHGQIEEGSVRCRHCSDIVNDEYRISRAMKRRAQINYASWVAYTLGLLALLVFRPVGLIAIGTGLLLSIIYYAIPVEGVPTLKGEGRWQRFWFFLRRQFAMERVSVPIPHFPKSRLVFVGTPVLAAVIGYFANFVLLQQPMNDILQSSKSFAGMTVSTHFEYWVVPGVIVYDLKSIGPNQSPLDVYGALLEYAKSQRNNPIRRVDLKYRGELRFSIDGATFRRAGDEYAKKNLDWVLFEFPRLAKPEGHLQQVSVPGGELVAFHRHWYVNDFASR